MGAKSRGCFLTGICLKDCEHKYTRFCDKCRLFSEYKRESNNNRKSRAVSGVREKL